MRGTTATWVRASLVVVSAGLVACGGPVDPIAPADPPAEATSRSVAPLRFLGEAIIPPEFDGPTVGGLSALFYAGGDLYYAISDDRGEHGGPARFYTLRIDLSDGVLTSDDVSVVDWTPLVDASGQQFEDGTYDLEGLVELGGELFVSSEGVAAAGIGAAIYRFDAAARLIDSLPIPAHLAPDGDGNRGVRNNLGFEALTATPSGSRIVTATENALGQDGPVASPTDESPSRLLVFDPAGDAPTHEYLYIVAPVHTESSGPNDLAVNGLVELIAVSEQQFLALERSFVASQGHSIKLFDICIAEADDVAAIESLSTTDRDAIRAVDKRLIVDLAELGIRVDNIEGMTLGPRLPAGEQTLLLISDDNFAPQRQITQVLAFAVSDNLLGACPRR